MSLFNKKINPYSWYVASMTLLSGRCVTVCGCKIVKLTKLMRVTTRHIGICATPETIMAVCS